MVEGDGLEDDITGGCRFPGTGEDGDLDGVGGELIEEVVVAAAADDEEAFDFLAGELLDLAESAAVEEGEAFQGAADESAFGFRRGLIGAAAELDDLGDH